MIHFLIFYPAERKQPRKKPSGNQSQTTGKTQESQRNLEGGHPVAFFIYHMRINVARATIRHTTRIALTISQPCSPMMADRSLYPLVCGDTLEVWNPFFNKTIAKSMLWCLLYIDFFRQHNYGELLQKLFLICRIL